MDDQEAFPRLAHVAVIVRSLQEGEQAFVEILGLALLGRTEVADEGVRISFLQVGEDAVELLEPLDPRGSLARYLAHRGQGVHHVAIEVGDLDAALHRARQAGLQIVGEGARPGAHGTKVAFIHPASTHGLLVELLQRG